MLYIGDTQVTDGGKLGGALSAYLGDLLVFPSAPTPPTPTPATGEYLTFIAREAGWFQLVLDNQLSNTLQYSLDSGATWTTIRSNRTTPTVQSGESIMWKGTGLTIDVNQGIGRFYSSGKYEARGNVMSLHFGDNFTGQTSLAGKANAFKGLFRNSYGNYNLIDAGSLALPATTLSDGCYGGFFGSCYNLVQAPVVLPAATLTYSCYGGMFQNCTAITSAPVICGTTMDEYSCEGMFYGCSNLTTAPELPATTLAYCCYYGMFSDCTSLNYVKCLATNLSATDCTKNWLTNVSSTGTFVKASSATWGTGVSGIPNGWTVVNS